LAYPSIGVGKSTVGCDEASPTKSNGSLVPVTLHARPPSTVRTRRIPQLEVASHRPNPVSAVRKVTAESCEESARFLQRGAVVAAGREVEDVDDVDVSPVAGADATMLELHAARRAASERDASAVSLRLFDAVSKASVPPIGDAEWLLVLASASESEESFDSATRPVLMPIDTALVQQTVRPRDSAKVAFTVSAGPVDSFSVLREVAV
jgi:hypothetical protein